MARARCPIPRDENDLPAAGGGADSSVPDDMVRTVADYISLPVIVGGGIRDAETARAVEAGASFVVTGSIVEDDHG